MVDIETQLKQGIWKGNDIPVAQSTILRPGSNLVSVSGLNHETERLASIAGTHRIQYSTRSRYAQVGMEVQQAHPSLDPKHQIKVKNYTNYDLRLNQGSSLFRPFAVVGSSIKGLELWEAIEDKQIIIDGQEGKEWVGEYRDPNNRKLENMIGMCIRITGERWKVEPENKSFISIKDNGSTRESVQSILKKVKDFEEPGFWISETNNIRLGAIDGLVSNRTLSSINPFAYSEGFQTDSSIFDRHITDWRGRVELVGPIRGPKTPNFVVVRFWKT